MLVSSQDNITESTQNWFTLTDNQQDGFFTVHLNNLTGEDTGVYLCGGQNPSPPFNKVLLVGGEARIIGKYLSIYPSICRSIWLSLKK